MTEMTMQRRRFLQTAVGLGGAALALPMTAHACSRTQGTPASLRSTRADALKLGVASYSMRKFTREQAIEMMKALRTPFISIKSFHLPYELSPTEIQAAARQFRAEGLQIVGGGVIYFEEDSDAELRKYFEYAKNAGMPMMTVSGPTEIWPRVERFVKEYDIQIAIHNHGPGDERYATPYDALEYIRDMDPRIGVCIDVGHTARTGTDVVKSIADAGSRLIDMHVKDLRTFERDAANLIVGEGIMPIAAIFRQLLAMNFQGHVNLEFEIDEDDPLPGMQRSMAHMRGVLAGLAVGTGIGAGQHGAS